MSGDGLLSLRWNNHRASFLHILSVLRTKDSYSDVTLACDGHFYAVHKFVLSTCSDYFVEMIEKTPCKHPVIVLKDIQKNDLEALLNYMYLGEVNVLQNDLARLIKAAECLRIKGLAVPDEAPSPAPPPTPGGGDGSGGGYADYADGRTNKTRRRRYESDNSEESSSPIRKRPATVDTNREKSSPERRHSRDTSGAPSREPTDSHKGGTQSGREISGREMPSGRDMPSGREMPSSREPQSGMQAGREVQKGREEVNVDLSNVKMEAEDLKYEDEPNYVEIEDSSDADTNMATGGEGSSSTTQPPPRSSSADISRVKLEQSSPRPRSSSQEEFQPQSIEDIVSQALPGASIVTGDGSGGPWDGGGSEGDSYQSFPFNQQQDSGGGMHRGSNMGPQHSGQSGSVGQPSSSFIQHQWNTGSQSQQHPVWNQHHTSRNITADVDKLHCPICGYRAVRPALLQIHIRKHTGEKPFKCPHCEYTSAQSSNLNAHIKRVHLPPDPLGSGIGHPGGADWNNSYSLDL